MENHGIVFLNFCCKISLHCQSVLSYIGVEPLVSKVRKKSEIEHTNVMVRVGAGGIYFGKLFSSSFKT